MKRLAIFLALLFSAIPALAACSSTTGSTFNETWTLGSDAYVSGGTATANQTWTLSSGSGQSLLSSGLPGSGWNCTTVLKMPPVSGGVLLLSKGKMPYVTGTTSYDLYWEMYVSSATFSSGDPLIKVLYAGSSPSFALYTQSSGTTGYYINGVTAITASQATYHLWHYHQVSNTTCELQVDGGSYTTSTCIGTDFNTIQLGGHNGGSGETIYIGNVYMTVSGISTSPTPPSAFMDMAGGTNGSTPTLSTLLGAIHGYNGGANNTTPSIGSNSSGETMTFSSTQTCPTFASSLTVAGSTYTGNVGLTLHHHITTASTPSAYVEMPFLTSYNAVSFGECFGTFYTGTTTSTDQSGLSGIMVFNVCDSTSTTTCSGTTGLVNHLLCVESNWDGADIGCEVVPNNAFIWITCIAYGGSSPVTGDECSIYNLNSNGTAGSLIGTVPASPSTTSWYAYTDGDAFTCGALGAEAPLVTVDAYCGNIIPGYADAAFPVLPPAASGHCGSCDLSYVNISETNKETR